MRNIWMFRLNYYNKIPPIGPQIFDMITHSKTKQFLCKATNSRQRATHFKLEELGYKIPIQFRVTPM